MKRTYGAERLTDLINAPSYQEVNRSAFWELACGRVTTYLYAAFDEMNMLSNDLL